MKTEYTRDVLEKAVKESFSVAETCRKIGKPSCPSTVKKYIELYNLNTEHFKGAAWSRGLLLKKNEKLVDNTSVGVGTLRKYIISERGRICEGCGRETWNNMPIPLEVHHQDGDKFNNSRENLKLLCPNCHALTLNYRGKNSNTGKIFVPDTLLVEALRNTASIRQALIKVGLAPKGGNYTRAKKLILRYGIGTS